VARASVRYAPWVKRLLIAAALAAAACRAPAAKLVADPPRSVETHSNVLRSDYVGSGVCGTCHERQYRAWLASPMHKMTQAPEQVDLRAPFSGETFVFKDDRATLFRSGRALLLRLASGTQGTHLYRVTRIIGNHYREDFAGVEVDSPEQPVDRGSGPELILPVTYYFESQGYRPKGYSVMTHERPGLRAGGTWNRTCIFCHNTVPWLDTALGALAGPNPPSYQGTVVDRTLPPALRMKYEVTSAHGLRHALADELGFLGGSLPAEAGNEEAARAAIRTIASRFEGRHLVEEGIGCESCHGGGREHAADPHVRTSYSPRSSFLDVEPADGTKPSRALLINRTCARCHQVLFSRYPFTWEGGLRHGAHLGGSSTTSGEARDFLLGGPGASLPCTACHDPHALDRPEALARLATAPANAPCTRCHPSYASRDGLAAHAHHDPSGPAGSCVACHMPRKNMALDYRLTRYHRIGSPTDRERVEGDRPLECALCHAEKSTESLLLAMERLWDKQYDRRRLQALYGDLDGNNLAATVARGRPHEQVVAAMTLAERRAPNAASLIAGLLTSSFPLARRFAAKALAEVMPAPCAIDVDAPVAEIEAALSRCNLNPGGSRAGPATIHGAEETPDED